MSQVRQQDTLSLLMLLAVQLQDLAVQHANVLATHIQGLAAADSTQQQTAGVQTASQAQLAASAALQQQALKQLIQGLAAGAGAPALLIQQLGEVAVI